MTSDPSLFQQGKEVQEPDGFGPCWRWEQKANLIDFILAWPMRTAFDQEVRPLACGRFEFFSTFLVPTSQFLSLVNRRHSPRYHFFLGLSPHSIFPEGSYPLLELQTGALCRWVLNSHLISLPNLIYLSNRLEYVVTSSIDIALSYPFSHLAFPTILWTRQDTI